VGADTERCAFQGMRSVCPFFLIILSRQHSTPSFCLVSKYIQHFISEVGITSGYVQ